MFNPNDPDALLMANKVADAINKLRPADQQLAYVEVPSDAAVREFTQALVAAQREADRQAAEDNPHAREGGQG